MENLTNWVNQKRIGSLLGLAVTIGLTVTPPARADVQFVPTPPDQGSPTGRQRGGATRGECLDYQGLSALVPEVDGVVWSQTASANPSFFFEIPAELTQAIPLEFVIQDSQDNYAFRKQFSLDAAAGILAIPVISNDAELSPGEAYTWTFSIYCDADRPSASVSVSGTVKRVDNSLVMEAGPELTPATQLDLIRQYAAEGIWHEAIGLAFNLYRLDPNNTHYLETLEQLFEQAALADISLTAPTYVEDEI
ncbi:MAG: DUF928 domain-containing protein [Cyanobacteria bacterium P01_F01_bin.4]